MGSTQHCLAAPQDGSLFTQEPHTSICISPGMVSIDFVIMMTDSNGDVDKYCEVFSGLLYYVVFLLHY